MPLEEYAAKRRFEKTPEPACAGERSASGFEHFSWRSVQMEFSEHARDAAVRAKQIARRMWYR